MRLPLTKRAYRADYNNRPSNAISFMPAIASTPVALLATCCGSKSLKVILIDSDFRAYPVLNPLVVFHTTCADFSRPVRRIGVYLPSEEHLHRSLTRQGLQDMADSDNLP
jgi:hypothetical protein